MIYTGNKTEQNEFVDRNNKPVSLGEGHNKFFKWGSLWKTPTGNPKDVDIDKSL